MVVFLEDAGVAEPVARKDGTPPLSLPSPASAGFAQETFDFG
ncbi:hypothetical protein AB0G98_24480 [Streptomyces sp. NPDC020196]